MKKRVFIFNLFIILFSVTFLMRWIHIISNFDLIAVDLFNNEKIAHYNYKQFKDSLGFGESIRQYGNMLVVKGSIYSFLGSLGLLIGLFNINKELSK